MTLLREIQAAALDSSVDLSDLLRKCKVLAARLKHAEFAAWVDHELNGYPDNGAVPPYRRLKVESQGHFSGPFGSGLRNANIPPSNIHKQFRHFVTDLSLSQSVSTLAQLAQGNHGTLQAKWPADLVKYVQQHCPIYENMVLADAWRLFPASTVNGVLDTVRTRILDFVLALEEKEPRAGDVEPGEQPKLSREAVSNVYNTTIINGQANIGTQGDAKIKTGTINFSSAIPKGKRKKVEALLRELHEKAAQAESPDREEAQHALAKVQEQLAVSEPALPKIKSYLELYATLVTVAAPTVEALQDLLAHILNLP